MEKSPRWLMDISITESTGKMKQEICRKSCMRISAAAAAWWLAVLLGGCGSPSVRQQTSVDTAMGTIVSQTLYVEEADGTDREAAPGSTSESACASVMEILKELEQKELSWRVEGSEVARINGLTDERESEEGQPPGQEKGIAVSVSPPMREILTRIWQVSEDSGGALDVTLGRLSRLWNLDGRAEEAGGGTGFSGIPADGQIQTALDQTGYSRVGFSEDGIILPPGMQLDLGAVGKGIACDRIRAYLLSRPQITGAVVAVGGSVVTYGQKPDGSPWKVAIVHPREEGNYLGVLSLTGEQFVSTSGDYERYVMVDGVRYHHILDPATGCPARSGLCSVTVVCGSGLLADALSTACFVLGSEQGIGLAETYGAEALLVEEDGTMHMTEGMRMIFSALE